MPEDVPRILVVEDNFLVAMDEQLMVEECGCIAVGPVSSVGAALELIRQTVLDGAVLDVNLGDCRVWPVAELLQERGVPFVLATGYDKEEVPAHLGPRPILTKPVLKHGLDAALRTLGVIR